MIKYGDKGSEVTEVQKYLSLLGYDLIIDGDFGDKTTRSLKAFQKKMSLTVDGLAGNKTIEALKAAQKRTAKEDKGIPNAKDYGQLSINREYQLELTQYLKQNSPKDKLFIHFTAGDKNAGNTIKYWDNDEPKIATAFVIDGETGQIFECFSPNFWSFHLGIKGTNGALDKTSIGIEICAYGPLKKIEDKYFAWPKNWTTEIPANEVYELDTEYRGFKYFHAYSEDQLVSLEKLLEFLIEEYKIKIQGIFDENWFDYKPELIIDKTPGVWTHVNVRKDKTDSYPDKRLITLLNRLSKKYNS